MSELNYKELQEQGVFDIPYKAFEYMQKQHKRVKELELINFDSELHFDAAKEHIDLLTVEQRNIRRLAKIHKLKRENRTLSSRRKELIKATVLDSKIWLKTVTECILTGREFKGIRQSFDNNTIKRQTQLNKISEQIGKNSAKIQRLRTLIGQDKARENRPEFYKFYEAGQQSKQAEIDLLQKRIDDALDKCCTGIRKQGGDYYLELVEGILKRDTK